VSVLSFTSFFNVSHFNESTKDAFNVAPCLASESWKTVEEDRILAFTVTEFD